MFTRLRFLGLLALAVGLLGSVAMGQMPPDNGVKFDPPPKGGANPDSPAAGSITAKGEVTIRAGWKCTSVDVTVKELPNLQQKDFQTGTADKNNKWSYAGNGLFTSKTTCLVVVTATFQDTVTGKFEAKSDAQTVSVK